MFRVSSKLVLLAVLLCLASLTLGQPSTTTSHHGHDHGEPSTTTSHHGHDHGDEDDHDSHDHDDHAHSGEASGADIAAAFGITCFAGCAAFVGASAMFCVKREQIGLMPIALAFAGAIVVYLAFMALFPECLAELEHAMGDDAEDNEALVRFYGLLCVIAGLALTALMEFVFARYGMHEHHHPEASDADDTAPATTSSGDEPKIEMVGDGDETAAVKSVSPSAADDETELNMAQTMGPASDEPDGSRLSFVVALALIMHHFPEGIATFISLYYDFEFGILVAFALAAHDIPSGVCIAVPTYIATGSYKRPLLLCLIAALAYPLGALVGWMVLEVAEGSAVDAFIGVLFGVTAGIMLYIAFVELLPAAILSAAGAAKRGHKKVYGYAIGAIFVGFLVMEVSSILLAEAGGHSH